MNPALPANPPDSSLLLALERRGAFTDCYALEIPMPASQAQFVEAFYTSSLFRAERFILKVLASEPSTDQDARDLAQGTKDNFAVWRVAHRTSEQLLLTDQTGRTSSWLMAVPDPTCPGAKTKLFIGSAVIGRSNAKTGKQDFSFVFHALLGLHDIYSRRLLQAAASKLLADKKSHTQPTHV